MQFSNKVREARKSLGITQRELADRLGVSLRTVASYEAGKSLPRTREATAKLSEVLGVSVNYLLTDDESFIVSSTEEFGYRGKIGAEKLIGEITGLFAGGEMAEEDMDALMFAIHDAYIQAKKNNKKYGSRK